jgi:hypothetical protein
VRALSKYWQQTHFHSSVSPAAISSSVVGDRILITRPDRDDVLCVQTARHQRVTHKVSALL